MESESDNLGRGINKPKNDCQSELEGIKNKLESIVDKLKTNDEFLNNLIESIPYPFYVIDASDYSIILANSVATERGVRKGTTCYAVTHQRDEPCGGEDHYCPLQEVKKTKRPYVVEHIHFDTNGRPRNYEVHGYPITDKSGNVVQMLEYSLDITERKQAEEGLKKERDKAQSYLDVAGVIILVIGADRKVSLINKKGCEALGYQENEIIGKDWFQSFLPERNREEVKNVFEKLMKGEIELTEYFENPIINRNGEERIVEWHNTILRDESGKITGTLSSGKDITERKKAEKEIKFLASIVQNDPDAVCSINTKGDIISWNKGAEEMLGFTRKDILGKDINTIIPKEIGKREIEHCINTLNLDGFFSGHESQRLTKDGKMVPVEITGLVVRDSEHKVTGYASIMRDITERKRAYEELKSIERLKTDVITNVSHELKTPITIISGSMELALEKIDPVNVTYHMNKAREALKRLEATIDDLVAVGKVEISKPYRIPENIESLIEEEIKKSSRIAESKNVKVELVMDENLPLIPFEKEKIRHVMGNLIENAIKFNRDGGKVEIKARFQRDSVEISVADTGIGIKEEDMPKLFKPLTQLDPSTKRKYGGTGSGLAVSRKFIEAHGGKIWAESNFGHGSTFYFTLPLRIKD